MFLENPPFPSCPSFGFVAEPMYSVAIIETAGGHEDRNRNWSRPRLRITATVGPRAEDEIQAALAFWHAVGGQAYGFRFQDGTDYKSCYVGDDPTALDQPLVETTDSPSVYQLTKVYTVGALSQYRDIYKPIQGTLLIADAGVTLNEGSDYTVDYTRGRVSFSSPPAGALTWGGEFDVPVRFDSEFPVELVDKKIQSVQFVLKELRGENAY